MFAYRTYWMLSGPRVSLLCIDIHMMISWYITCRPTARFNTLWNTTPYMSVSLRKFYKVLRIARVKCMFPKIQSQGTQAQMALPKETTSGETRYSSILESKYSAICHRPAFSQALIAPLRAITSKDILFDTICWRNPRARGQRLARSHAVLALLKLMVSGCMSAATRHWKTSQAACQFVPLAQQLMALL